MDALTPFPYQLEIIERIQVLGGRVLLSLDQGTGKTLTSAWWSEKYLKRGPIIVVCPASVKWQWHQELLTHCGIRGVVLGRRDPETYGPVSTSRHLYLINYDILEGWLPFLQSLQPRLLILDECQLIKNRAGRRRRYCKQLAKGVKHILALSGTPLTSRPAELWSILNLLRPDLYSSFPTFGERFCNPKKTSTGEIDYSGASHLDELNQELLQHVMIRKRKAEVLKDLPPLTRCVVPLELTNYHLYQQALNETRSWLRAQDWQKPKGEQISARLNRFNYLKLVVGRLKLDAILQWVEDRLLGGDGKLLFFAVHKKIVRGVYQKFASQAVFIDGSVPDRQRQERVTQLTTNPLCRLLSGNIQAAGVGLNCQAADTIACGEFPWNPSDLSQMEARAHRQGQTKPVQVYYLVAKDTIEMKVLEILQRKQLILDQVLDGQPLEDSVDVYDLMTKEILKGD